MRAGVADVERLTAVDDHVLRLDDAAADRARERPRLGLAGRVARAQRDVGRAAGLRELACQAENAAGADVDRSGIGEIAGGRNGVAVLNGQAGARCVRDEA